VDIQIISNEDLYYLKSNLASHKDYYREDNNEWLNEVFEKSPFIPTKYNGIKDVKLKVSEEKPHSTDGENAVIVYDALNFLSDSTASDERLWSALALGPFWEYTKARWKKSLESTSGVKQHFYYGYGNRRSLTRNAISRLWWIARLTYDKNRSNPYELTELVCSASDFILHAIERNTSNSKEILIPFLDAIKDAREIGMRVNTDDVGELSKYLNLLGGVYLLDCLSREFIYNKIFNKIQDLNKASIVGSIQIG